jgi:hypothetical protein
MIIDQQKTLELFVDRLLPDKYKDTTFEKVVASFLKQLNNDYQYIDNFTNRFDIDKIDIENDDSELDSFIKQYASVIQDITNIVYPNLITNNLFDYGYQFWGVKVPVFNSKTATTTVYEYYDRDTFSIGGNIFRFDRIKNNFVFSKVTTRNNNIWYTLEQDQVFSGDKTKFEISFDVDSIQAGTFVKVFCGQENDGKLVHSYIASSTGTHRFRIDYNTTSRSTGAEATKFTFQFNGNVTISNITVTEYGRIEKEDIQVLSAQITQNKGRLGLYTFLFNLLKNLGSQENLDLTVKVDENDVVSADTQPRITISEIYQSTRSNIKYGEINPNTLSPYTLAGQEFYDKGYAFKEYVTSYNVDEVVPFIYKLDATFAKEVFERFILPIAHPVGWNIIYNVFKLVEAVDRLPSFSEVDNSKYYHNVLFYEGVSSRVYDADTLGLLNDNDLKDIRTISFEHDEVNILNAYTNIENVTVTMKLNNIGTDSDTVNSATELDLSKYFDTIVMDTYDGIDTLSSQTETYADKFYEAPLHEDTLDAISFYYNAESIKYNLNSDTVNALTELDLSLYNYLLNMSLYGGYDIVIMQEDEITHTTSRSSSLEDEANTTFAMVFGDNNLFFDEGSDMTFGGVQETLENDSIGINAIPVITYYSSNTNANLVHNETYVLKIVNYGHGIDNNRYLYIGENTSSVNLSQVDFKVTANWFNVDKRIPV